MGGKKTAILIDTHLSKILKETAMARNPTWVNCLEGSYARHYTTIARAKQPGCQLSTLHQFENFGKRGGSVKKEGGAR